MAKAKRPRPSFSPSPPPAGREPGVGWVSRSAEPPAEPPAFAEPPSSETPLVGVEPVPLAPPAPGPTAAAPSRGTSVADALMLPFVMMILTALPVTRCLGRSRASAPTDPSS